MIPQANPLLVARDRLVPQLRKMHILGGNVGSMGGSASESRPGGDDSTDSTGLGEGRSRTSVVSTPNRRRERSDSMTQGMGKGEETKGAEAYLVIALSSVGTGAKKDKVCE